MVGLAGEGQNFDGNGMYVRFQTGGGDADRLARALGAALTGQLFGQRGRRRSATRPAYPGKRPPYKPDVPCYKNALPNLNGRRRPARPTAAGGSAARPRASRGCERKR